MDAVIIAFASGKGGTGKSTAAVFTGGALAGLGKKVVVIELNRGLRSIDIIAGVSEQTVFDIEDVLSGRSAPSRAFVESPAYRGMSIISAPFAGGGIVTANLHALCDRLRPYFDYILLDLAAGFGPLFDTVAALAHRMVLLLTPDPVALRDGRVVADAMEGRPAQLRLVLNRVDPARILRDGILPDLDTAIDTVGAQLLGLIPDSPAIYKAACLGQPLPPHSREAAVFSAIARRITGEEVPLIVR